jgi:ABC-type cobalamin/Fe3+-siderophores transport system ATPase subunit
MLELQNISFGVTEDNGTGSVDKEILNDINLTIEDNKFVVITGPNGGGKSTLAKIIAGIEKPTSGRILLDGQDITDKNITEGVEMEVMNISAPIVFDKLAIEKNKLWNECMTFIGINNANMDKRERLVDDEVQANNEQIGYSAEVMLKSRQRAAEAMSKLCGTEITVELRRAQKPAPGEDPQAQQQQEGGNE